MANPALITTALLAAAAPASAMEMTWLNYSCEFNTECRGTDACTSAELALSFRQIKRPPQEEGRITFDPVTPPGMTEVSVGSDTFTGFAAAHAPDGMINWLHLSKTGEMHLFSLIGDTGRYSIHRPGAGGTVFYQGTCSEMGDS